MSQSMASPKLYSTTRLRLTDAEREATHNALDQYVRWMGDDDEHAWTALWKFEALLGIPYTERS